MKWTSEYLGRVLTPKRLLVLFTFMNLFNYSDRGVVPGAFEQIEAFARGHSNANTSEDLALGALQSSFVGGYAIASVIFGHLTHSYPAFKLMSIGLFIWCFAVLASGLAPNYWVLLVARVFSGAGEASFQTVIPPYLDDYAPPEKRALWLSIFFSAIPVGTALGFGYGSVLASAVSWRLPFLVEVPIMLPLACICLFLPEPPDKKGGTVEDLAPVKEPNAEGTGALLVKQNDGVEEDAPGVMDELKVVLSSPVFVTTVLGYASYAFVTAGFASFGPTMLVGLKLFKKETSASLMFGAVIAFTGFVGTAAGGVILDKIQERDLKKQTQDLKEAEDARRAAGPVLPSYDDDDDGHPSSGLLPGLLSHQDPVSMEMELAPSKGDAEEEEDSVDVLNSKMCSAGPTSFIGMLLGFILCMFCPFVSHSKALFFLFLGFGTTFLFATTASVNLAIMASVPKATRPFAIGISTILMHSLGDVPSPTIIGAVADKLSPEHPIPGSTDTTRSASGLRTTLALTILWLVFAVLFWLAAWMFALRRRRKRIADIKAGRAVRHHRVHSVSVN